MRAKTIALRTQTTQTMNYRFIAKTDPGLLRENNEDAACFDQARGVAVLADGMGGYNAGEVASSMAISIISSGMTHWLNEAGKGVTTRDIRRALEICVDDANLSIFNAASKHTQYAGMGTTLVAIVFHGTTLVVGHIGDSRCYRLRQREFSQITRDHSLLQEQMDAGLLTPEEAAVSVNKNLVTRALGVDPAVLLEVNEYTVEAGDVYLLCSDGLSDMVRDQDLAKIMQMPVPTDQLAQALIDSANANGGRDNITVLLAQVEAEPEKRGLMSRLLGK